MAPKYDLKHPFSLALWEFCKERGIPSYYALANQTGIPEQTVERIFSKNYGGPSYDTMRKLAGHFGCTPGEFHLRIETLYKKIKNKKR